MPDRKAPSVTKEKEQEFPTRQPSDKEQEVVRSIFGKFRDTADARNQNFVNFDNSNLIDYIDDSVHRFTTNVDFRDGIEDWQARVHDPFTRNKVLAFYGKMLQGLPICQAQPRGDEDRRRAQLLSNLYEYSEEHDDYDEVVGSVVLEAIVKGKGIGYEGHEHKEIYIRDIVSGDGDDIKIKESIKKTNELFGQVVRLEDFYPSSVSIPSVKKMPFCFWRMVMPYHQFMQDYAMYARAQAVQAQQASTEHDEPQYLDYVSSDVGDGDVEIIRYYNKESDEYVILANSVWLNPLMIGGAEVISPLPFRHKELPFWDIMNEPFDSTFFYGKSLPDKLKSLQDVLNVLTNMLLDQSFLTVFKPLLTNGFDSIEDDYLRPGRRTPIDTQGLSIKDAVVELDMSAPTGWHQYILDYTRKIMEEASVDKTTQGIAGVGERTTAQEIRMAAEGMASILGILGRQMQKGIKQKAMLRIKNIQQFYTDPKNPIIEMVLGEGGTKDFNEAFNTFKLDGAVMTNGKRGKKIIEMYKDRENLPGKGELSARAQIAEIESGSKIEIIAIPGDYIRDCDVDIVLVANPKTDQTRDIDKALQLEKVRVYKSFWPNMINDEELLASTAEKMGDDPTKIIKEEIWNPPPKEGGAEQQGQQMSMNPTSDASNNIMRGAMGGEMNNAMQLA